MTIKSLLNKAGLKTIPAIWGLAILVLLNGALTAKPQIVKPKKKLPTAFAIIVDSKTYSKIGPQVDAYRQAVEDDGLSSYLVADDWQNPEQVRKIIESLAMEDIPLEGVVFVGDIPIPMIRDAQHMTSAFKMTQDNPKRFPFIESSIPSDRYYDDFDLKFQFIKQDSLHPLLFYYFLTADSPQRVERDIYSGRIHPSVEGERKYELIDNYLKKVVESKKHPEKLDRMLVTTGHGYYSESLNAWSGEIVALRDQFPELYQPGGMIKTFYHSMTDDLKEEVLQQLQEPGLDVALFHAHGQQELQYLLGSPATETVRQQIDAVQYFLRSKLRQAKRRKQSLEKAREYYMKNYNVPESWFAGAFDDSVTAADTLAEYKLDIHIQDIRNMAPQPRFVMFDECFNGAFIHNPYIAGEYIFGNGKTVATVANSVNVLQDQWADEHIGLLAQGLRVGEWHRHRNYLETHIIGDPTFHFAASGHPDLGRKMILREKDAGAWKSLLSDKDASLRALALEETFGIKKASFEKELVNFYKNDPSYVVRMEALKCLSELRTPAFENILETSINDPYELIRRFTARWMGDVGKELYLPALVDNIIWDTAVRVTSASRDAVAKIGAVAAAKIAREKLPAVADTVLRKKFEERFDAAANYNNNWLHNELIPNMKSDTLNLKKRISAVRTFRNYRFVEALPELEALAMDAKQPAKLRITILETLGWFNFNHNRNRIVAACETVMKQQNVPEEVKAEAQKTANRIRTGANNPLTP